MKPLDLLRMSGADVLPLVEGGKGIAATSGMSAGAWAASGGVGTFSGVNPQFFDEGGGLLPFIYRGKTRRERHDELIEQSIRGGITQAQIAHETASGNGRLHVNVLWEMGGCERVLHGILEGARGLIHGVTCGAGMPYRLAQIAAQFGVYYYPIVSSGRAFRALWKRSYHRVQEWLGAVVYEDPWRAGGHNGLSNSENPEKPQDPYPRVVTLRKEMNAAGLHEVPIIMAGGVWYLREWEHWIDNPEIGPVAFQFGTRPLLTRESPIPDGWKQALMALRKGDVLLHKFSPTGFFSSAVKNSFLRDLVDRSNRQITYRSGAEDDFTVAMDGVVRGRTIWVREGDDERIRTWRSKGYTEALKTPDGAVVFETPAKAKEIRKDQADCMGCLSQCSFSNWADNETNSTGRGADPRSFCIQKTLQNISRGADVDHELMFAGHSVYRFGSDPFYSNGFVPSVRQLIDRLLTGD